jgi:hypothetical protein
MVRSDFYLLLGRNLKGFKGELKVAVIAAADNLHEANLKGKSVKRI